jgi:hypothetical protein
MRSRPSELAVKIKQALKKTRRWARTGNFRLRKYDREILAQAIIRDEQRKITSS